MTLSPLIALTGIYDLSDPDYFADPVIEPSLNNSIAKVLIGQSPRHAYVSHPRLGGSISDDDETNEVADVGTAAHQMFLHGVSKIRVIEAPDFRTKAAKDARDAALRDGCIPLKAERYAAVLQVVEALEAFRAATGAFTDGKAEQTLVWQEDEQWCRCKPDWLPNEPSAHLWDLKTTGNANSRAFARIAFDKGYDMQASFYARGAECVRGEPPAGMKFCVIETRPPYGLRVFELSPQALEVADAQTSTAISVWKHCRRNDAWPGYSFETEFLDPPVWKLREWEGNTRTGSGLRRVERENTPVVERMIRQGSYGG